MRMTLPLLVLAFVLSTSGCAPSAKGHAPRLVYASDLFDREHLGTRMRRILRGRRYERLEFIADSLQRGDVRFEDGQPQLSSFYYFGMAKVDRDDDPADWVDQLDEIREWRDGMPESIHAPVALASALIGRGWAARGSGTAPSVSSRGWRGFEADLDEAQLILYQCADRAKGNPEWYVAMLEVLLGRSAPRAECDSMFAEAIRHFPNYARLYTTRSRSLQPRWFGKPGEWEREAKTYGADLSDSLRDELYARVVVFQTHYAVNLFLESPDLIWDRTQHGLEVWQARFPLSTEPTAELAFLAGQTGRLGVARAAFERIGDRVDIDVWHDPTTFLAARRKASAN